MRPLAARFLRSVCLPVFFLILGVTTWAQQLSVPPRIVERIDETKRTVLLGNTHRLALPQFDHGAAPPDLPMKRMLLVLKRSPDQERGLLSLLDDQQDKASPNYHQWLTPEKFGKQFGPADRDIQTVTTWLRSHGFEIGRVAKGKNMIEFSGVARQVQEAFHTAIHKYVVNGEEHWANANDPEIPTALTPVVAGVHTLHNFLKKPMMHVAEQKIQGQLVMGKDGKPHVTFPGSPPLHALGPADFATIYNINPLYQMSPPINGFNQKIAVVARTDFNGGDVFDFLNVFGIPVFVLEPPTLNGQDPGDLGGGEDVEFILDVTWSQAVARVATIYPVVSASTNSTDGVDLSELYIVDNNFASIMTESFGSCEADHTSAEALGFATLAEQAAAQGITYLVASGDSGAEGCSNPNLVTVASGDPSVNVLSATPFNVAVGGTMFNENGQDSKYWNATNDPNTFSSALSYIPENVWNESCLASQCGESAGIWAGGGGASTFFAKPSWQSGVAGIPNDGKRDVPDVSLTAAGHDPYLLCVENSCVPDSQGFISFAAVSGTSASTPAFAGIMALVEQKMGGPQGQAGYVLYKLAASEKLSTCNASNTTGLPASTCVFNDVTVGNNAVPGEPNYGKPTAQYQSGVGYDLATGLGSVNVTNLVEKWNTVSFTPTITTLSLGSAAITHGQPVNVSITVAPKSGTGTPTGDVSLLNSNNQGLGFFSLSGGSVASTINSLPGGTYTVTGRYAGDGTFAPSTSVPTPIITVSPENSTVTLTAQTLDQNFNFIPFTSGPYGSFVYLRADVAGQSGNGTPTGFVGFNDTAGPDSIQGNPYTLNSQGNAATPNFLNSPNGGTPTGLFTLAPGAHSITAAYLGDQSFNQNVSSAVSLSITQAPTSTVAAGTGAFQGASLLATVKTGSGGNPPSGTVQFFINGSAVGTPATVIQGFALTTLTGTLQGAQATAGYGDTALANGTPYTVKATYSGDSNYLSSTSPSVPFTLQTDFLFEAGQNDTGQSEIDIPSPGSSGILVLSISALDGYKGAVNFSSTSCSGLPVGASCSFNPSSITGSGETTMTVSTTAAKASMLYPNSIHGPGLWAMFSAVGFAGLVWFGVPTKRRGSFNLLALLFCALVITALGCGGGGSSPAANMPPPPPPPPTPAGVYTVVVTATSGSLTHKLSFTLNVL